ncbi:MAG: hypothetical protein KAR42_01910 [candidate division Zixibacteria bacterium]|nr:hypothetical protein [candidate division Zixibacteria bacterium]
MRCWLFIPISLFIGMINVSCDFDLESQPISIEEVPGKYEADFGDALIHYFELHEDSTYVKYYMGGDSLLYQDTGKWEFTHQTHGRSYDLTLTNFKPRFEESEWKLEEITFAAECGVDTLSRGGLLKKYFDGISFEYCHTARQHYKKKKTE